MIGQYIKNAIAPALFLVAVAVLVVIHCGGCAPHEGATLPAYCSEEALYTAKLMRCVDDAKTLAESKQCREAVDNTCGIVQTVTVRK